MEKELEQEKIDDEVTFVVDLSKGEYLKFYRILTRYSSAAPLQRFGVFLVLVMVAIPLISLYQRSGLQAVFSLDALSLCIPALLLIIYNHIVLPLFRKRQAERGYEAAIAGGQVFAGTVTVSADKITKITPTGTLTMSFRDRVLFHEQEDMQLFVNAQGRGIVLPARCMTADNAKAVREIATAALPSVFCKIKSWIRAERETPMEYIDAQPIVPDFETDVEYNREDRKVVAKEISFRQFKKGFFSNCLISFFTAFIFGFGHSLEIGLLLFLGLLIVLTCFLAFSTRRRTKILLADEHFRFTFKMMKQAVVVDGGHRRGVYSIPWEQVRHVYESEKYLEFHSKQQYICIPKRLIADMDGFEKLVDIGLSMKERKE